MSIKSNKIPNTKTTADMTSNEFRFLEKNKKIMQSFSSNRDLISINVCGKNKRNSEYGLKRFESHLIGNCIISMEFLHLCSQTRRDIELLKNKYRSLNSRQFIFALKMIRIFPYGFSILIFLFYYYYYRHTKNDFNRRKRELCA